VIDSRSAADHGSSSNVVRDAALRYGDGSVADLDVTGDADLSSQNNVVAYVGGAGEAYLGAEQRVVSYGATVAHVDEVVQLRALSNAGFAYAGSVDAGVGLDLDIALDYDVAGLHDFVPVSVIFIFGEAETVAAYDGAILQQNVVS